MIMIHLEKVVTTLVPLKVGGVTQNIYGPSVKGVPNPGVRIEPKTDAQRQAII